MTGVHENENNQDERCLPKEGCMLLKVLLTKDEVVANVWMKASENQIGSNIIFFELVCKKKEVTNVFQKEVETNQSAFPTAQSEENCILVFSP